MHRFAHRVVASERKGDVAHPTADFCSGTVPLDLADGCDKVDRVGVVFLHPGGDREDVRVEDDVVRGEANFLGEQPVGPSADGDLLIESSGLPLLVKGHHYRRCTVLADFAGLSQKSLLAFFEADRIDHALALDALESGFDN